MTSALALALAMSIAPAQGGALNVSNVRQTYGELGSSRSDTRYLPRDFVFVSFDIEGLKAGPDGRVIYSMGMEVIDKAGKAIFTAPPAKQEMLLPLGAAKLPAFIYVTLGPDMPAGAYTARVTVIDETSKASSSGRATTVDEVSKSGISFGQKFELLPPAFGIVALYVTKDDKGMLACGPTGVVGQTSFVNFGLVGFGRDASGKPNAAVEFRILDEKGQAVNPQPIVVPVPREFAPGEQFVPFQIMLPMNREGSFTVELMAADKVSGKNATVKFPLRIHPSSK
ncbi:MAG: hypothetical protein K1X57_19165 [Gemmataceae bacterium]|nr:hypothetical protein [Gemmataceae bacterium]